MRPIIPHLLENRIVLLLIILLCIILLIPIIIASVSLSVRSQPEDDTPDNLTVGQAQEIRVFVAEEKKVVPMDLEEYILRVVSAEMPASYEPEALKAQACAARTFSVSKMLNGGCNRAENAQVCTSSSHCQAYNSPEEMKKNWGSEYLTKYNKIKKAVEETKGLVIVYDNEPISALYHSTSGGYTENSEDVFVSAQPYLRSVKSEGEEPYAPRFYGEVKVPYKEFVSKVHSFNKNIEITENNIEKKITDIKRSDTNRVLDLKIDGKSLTGRDMRGLFDLNSTNFKISFEDGSVVFDTVGFGHGVGMSQTGANAMAKSGSKYDEILKHYYTGVSIVPMANLKG